VFLDTYASISNCETNGSMAEWLMAADCKSAGVTLRWFKSDSAHFHKRPHSSVVEHFIGNEEVMGSNPIEGFEL
jgi:hypothetical protein